MSKLDTKERDALSDDDFGDPKNRLFPIVDQDDVDSASKLIGKAENPKAVKATIIEIATKKGLKLPIAWQSKGKMSTFALASFAKSGDSMIRSGKVFECGDYPDRDFSFSEDEADAAIKAFAPVDNDLEHLPSFGIPTILDGKLGKLLSLKRVDDEIFADIEIPLWLNDEIGDDKPLKVSLQFDTQKKTIVGNALCLEPRIADAQVLVGAFARFAGSRHSAGDMEDIQKIHDLTVSQGATCGNIGKEPEDTSEGVSDWSRQAAGGAAKGKSMTLKQKLLAYFRADTPEAKAQVGLSESEIESLDVAEKATFSVDENIVAQLSEFKKDNDRLKLAAANNAAKLFADSVIRIGKAVPAQRKDIEKTFQMGATLDGGGTVRFNESGGIFEGENVKAVRDMFENAVSHKLFTQEIAGANPDGYDADAHKLEKERLMKLTPMGQKALKEVK